MPRIQLSREVAFLLTLCSLDAFSSVYLFQAHLATESNPLLRHAAAASPLPFLTIKLLSFLPALALAEWYRRRRPEFVLPLLRWVGALYVAVYVLSLSAQFVLNRT